MILNLTLVITVDPYNESFHGEVYLLMKMAGMILTLGMRVAHGYVYVQAFHSVTTGSPAVLNKERRGMTW